MADGLSRRGDVAGGLRAREASYAYLKGWSIGKFVAKQEQARALLKGSEYDHAVELLGANLRRLVKELTLVELTLDCVALFGEALAGNAWFKGKEGVDRKHRRT